MSDIVKLEPLSVSERLAALPPAVQALFANPENGTHDNISKTGCLALARLGKDVWNAWREAFPVEGEFPHSQNCADFTGVDFRGDPLDFSGFVFGDDANFSGATFGDRACFNGALWGRRGKFQNARWGIQADFRGAQWGELANFQEAQWANGARFQQAQWGGMTSFHAARWGEGCNFESAQWACACNFIGANWGGKASFKKACWARWAEFQNAQWGENADFSYASWGQKANFEGAAWGGGAVFTGARWEVETSFCGAKWAGNARFEGAQWGRDANFERASWGGDAKFSAAQWGVGARFYGASWLGNATFCGKSFHEAEIYYRGDKKRYQAAKDWAEARGLSPNTFQSISFSGAHFAAEVDFLNRKFTGRADFGCLPLDGGKNSSCRSQFYRWLRSKPFFRWIGSGDAETRRHVLFSKAPKFHGCELHQDTTFDGAEFPKASGSDEAARAYRTLKLAFNKQQAHREEQRFFKLELQEEAKRAGFASGLYWLYGVLSDYGFSLLRPLLWFGVTLVIFAVLYGGYDSRSICWSPEVSCAVQWSWLNYSVAQSLPLTGLDRLKSVEELKEIPVPVFVVAFHKSISLACLFFAGLALRNRFRL